MRKLVRIGFPILCVAVVGGTLIAVKNLKNKADQIAKEKNTVNYSNTVVSTNTTNTNSYVHDTYYTNTVNTTNNVKNTSVNTVANTAVANNTKTNTNTVGSKTPVTNTANTETTTEDLSGRNEKEKAVTLVAKEWGEDSSVYFTNEGISNGLYIVAVRDKSNTSVKMFYKVDLKNNKVEVDW